MGPDETGQRDIPTQEPANTAGDAMTSQVRSNDRARQITNQATAPVGKTGGEPPGRSESATSSLAQPRRVVPEDDSKARLVVEDASQSDQDAHPKAEIDDEDDLDLTLPLLDDDEPEPEVAAPDAPPEARPPAEPVAPKPRPRPLRRRAASPAAPPPVTPSPEAEAALKAFELGLDDLDDEPLWEMPEPRPAAPEAELAVERDDPSPSDQDAVEPLWEEAEDLSLEGPLPLETGEIAAPSPRDQDTGDSFRDDAEDLFLDAPAPEAPPAAPPLEQAADEPLWEEPAPLPEQPTLRSFRDIFEAIDSEERGGRDDESSSDLPWDDEIDDGFSPDLPPRPQAAPPAEPPASEASEPWASKPLFAPKPAQGLSPVTHAIGEGAGSLAALFFRFCGVVEAKRAELVQLALDRGGPLTVRAVSAMSHYSEIGVTHLRSGSAKASQNLKNKRIAAAAMSRELRPLLAQIWQAARNDPRGFAASVSKVARPGVSAAGKTVIDRAGRAVAASRQMATAAADRLTGRVGERRGRRGIVDGSSPARPARPAEPGERGLETLAEMMGTEPVKPSLEIPETDKPAYHVMFDIAAEKLLQTKSYLRSRWRDFLALPPPQRLAVTAGGAVCFVFVISLISGPGPAFVPGQATANRTPLVFVIPDRPDSAAGSLEASSTVTNSLQAVETAAAALGAPPSLTPPGTILDQAGSIVGLEQFVLAAERVGLRYLMQPDVTYTVFAPNDAAFADIQAGELAELFDPGGHERLLTLLSHHIVPERLELDDLSGTVQTFTTLAGQSLTIDGTQGVRVGPSVMLQANHQAVNGILHILDGVVPVVIR